LWSDDFSDECFLSRLRSWLVSGRVEHDLSHVHPVRRDMLDPSACTVGQSVAARLHQEKAIMGVFDEGCMGMYNAIIPDNLLAQTGIFKERLSQSTLYYETTQVTNDEASEALRWLLDR